MAVPKESKAEPGKHDPDQEDIEKFLQQVDKDYLQ